MISILAATPTARIEAAYPGAPVYRLIPNIPAEVGKGVLCYSPGSRADAGPEQEILELVGRAGTVIRLDDEALIEPAMAIMSCGPAFYALLAEAFADAGVAHGLDRVEAARMSVETMAGAAASLDTHELGLRRPARARRDAGRRHRARAERARGRAAPATSAARPSTRSWKGLHDDDPACPHAAPISPTTSTR